MKIKTIGISCLFGIFGLACSEYTPKPRAHFRIELPVVHYQEINQFSDFSFELSDQSRLELIKDSAMYEWFDIVYPNFHAKIHCSYIPVKKDNFLKIEEESKNFAYLHLRKANAFQEQDFENKEQNVYGTIYEIKGNVVSPIQFILTDSVHSFFRGSLYFDYVPQQDSISPVLDYIHKDIQVLIESFRWKK